jgi:O-antigen ligase
MKFCSDWIPERVVKAANASVVVASAVVALAAVLGGAFYPGPRVAVGVLLAVTLAALAASLKARLAAEEWTLLALLAWGVVAAALANGAPLAAREVVTTWAVAWCLWVAARRVDQRAGKLALTVLVGAAVILAAGVGFEAFGLARFRVGGLLENPNLTASILVITMPVILVLGNGRAIRWRLPVALCLGGGVVLTGSRAGLLAVLAAAAMILPRGRLRTVGLFFGALGAAGVVAWRFLDQPDILAWFRPAIWGSVLRLWADHPLRGVGPGGLVDAAGGVRLLHPDHVGQHQFLAAYAESSPLGLLVQTGTVGFLLAVLAVVFWLRGGRARKVLASAPLRASLVAAIVMTAFHDLLTADVVLWWWALVFGLLGGGIVPLARADTEPGMFGVRFIRAAAIGYVVLWGMVQPAWARWLWSSAEPNVDRVDRSVRAEPWFDTPLEWRTHALFHGQHWTWETAAEALARSQRAVQVHPGAARSWSDLGLVQSRVITDFGPWQDAVEGARNAFHRATELEPHLPWSWLEWARLERTLGNPDKARQLVRQALSEEPHTVRAWLFLARLELDAGRVEEAVDAFDRARTSIELNTLPGLNGYERELLAAPSWQLQELEDQLQ